MTTKRPSKRADPVPIAGPERSLSKADPTLCGMVDGFDIVTDKRMHARTLARACTARLTQLGYITSGLNSIGTRDDRGHPMHTWPASITMDARGKAIATLRVYALHYAATPPTDAPLWHAAMRRLATVADAEILDGYRSQRIAQGPRQRPRGPVWRTVEMIVEGGAKDAAAVLRKLSDPDEMDRPGNDFPIVVCSEAGEDPITWYPRGSDEAHAESVSHKRVRNIVGSILKTAPRASRPR